MPNLAPASVSTPRPCCVNAMPAGTWLMGPTGRGADHGPATALGTATVSSAPVMVTTRQSGRRSNMVIHANGTGPAFGAGFRSAPVGAGDATAREDVALEGADDRVGLGP